MRATLLFYLIPFLASAQTGGDWTLMRAVNYAKENNLQVRR